MPITQTVTMADIAVHHHTAQVKSMTVILLCGRPWPPAQTARGCAQQCWPTEPPLLSIAIGKLSVGSIQGKIVGRLGWRYSQGRTILRWES